MSKKEENILGLAPLGASPTSTTPHLALVPFTPGREITREEQRVYDLFQKERAIIEATGALTQIGMSTIGELSQHGAETFDHTVGYILAVKDDPRGREHQLYVDEFSKQQIQMLARHLYGATEVGATNIGLEIHRSLYLPPEPPPSHSLWQRLFGR